MAGSGYIPVSFFVLTCNEGANIGKCLAKLTGLSDDIHIVDSGSTDQTRELAGRFPNLTIHHHDYTSFAVQRDWALNNLPFRYEWVFMMDADYEVSPALADKLRHIFHNGLCGGYSGFYIRWVFCFMGRRMRFGSHSPRYKLQLFKKNSVYLKTDEAIDPRVYIKSGKVGYISAPLIENDMKDLDFHYWVSKLLKYSKGVVREELSWNNTSASDRMAHAGKTDRRILRLKSWYYNLPLYIRPFIYFAHDYFIKLGFLEGKEGFILHFFRNLWYRMLIDVLIDQEKRRQKSDN